MSHPKFSAPPIVLRLAVVAAAITLIASAPGHLSASAQGQDPSEIQEIFPKAARKIMYVMPNWLNFINSDDATIAAEVNQLRTRIGEGKYVRNGFNVYIFISMENWNVDTSSPTAVRAELTSTFNQIDSAIAKARTANIPISLSLLTAIRARYDPVQTASEREDRRNMQWYWDNVMAGGWWTLSRYARKQHVVMEAYMREIAKVVANRMAKYPSILVAATGDGEVEMTFDRTSSANPVIADYSPFAIAEFRDWLRNAGMYAPGQPYAGQGYESASRYQGDASPGTDTNGDGRTLNGDFGTNFSTWSLRYFDWSLNDNINGDPNAIPVATYEAPGWNPMPDTGADRFDAPRVRQDTPFWRVWTQFRQTMLRHYNVDFARWMTTTPDPETGLTIPEERWYSDQIPADFLYGNPPADLGERLETSASPWWTAMVAPYGSLGLTTFNVVVGEGVYPTLRHVAPVVAQQNVRWGIIEWNPAVPASTFVPPYRDDMAIVERYKPALVVPIYWGHDFYQVQNTPFEYELKALVDRIKDNPSFGETPVDLESPPPTPTVAPVQPPRLLPNVKELMWMMRERQRWPGEPRVQVPDSGAAQWFLRDPASTGRTPPGIQKGPVR